ncbi:hypothetical protein NDU88_000477 [Pleurodeles waltl]|uniref:Reverse transcriptase domain-containing protein n=1 Tax=Pleurodeles waltl TaxID=8319 RepID=A0AAV7VU83_PLEWA|nr:hypothetical protein NDU88_000477 [Pleurodeles waltl]
MKVPPRPVQFEALAIWELIAKNQQQKKFETRIRKVEKTLADARWDSTQKVWRSDVLQGIKLFPAITDEAETEGRKATYKTNRSQSRDRENNRNSKRSDESDDEEFIIQLLNDRPPPYVESKKGSSISTAPPEPTDGNEEGDAMPHVRNRRALETGVPNDGAGRCSDGEEEDGVGGDEVETVDEEYPLITLYPMLTEADIPAELQETVGKEVWDMTGKEVGLVKGIEPVKVTVKPNVTFPQTPQYHMAQDTLMKVAQLIDEFVKQGVLKEVLSSPCNSPSMGLIKPSGNVRIVQDLRKINDIIVKCCHVVPNPAVIMFQVPCDAEWFSVIDLSQAFFSVPLHEDSQFLFCFKFLDRVYSWC